ncbi:MAG: domain containing protein [Pedosphaera sp.]|nr:domain containing protein [Pedosphaera sp.]
MAKTDTLMEKRRRILTIALLFAVLSGFVWLILHPKEPIYQGKTLSFWLEQYYRNKDIQYLTPTNRIALRNEARTALVQIGTNATPYYLKLVGARISRVQERLLRSSWPYHIPWMRASYIRWVQERDRADITKKGLSGFEILGTSGAPAVPDLIRLLSTGEDVLSPDSVTYALSFIGPAATNAVPVLIHNFSVRRGASRDSTIAALSAICFDNKARCWRPECSRIMVPTLIQSPSDSKSNALDILAFLSGLGGDAKAAVPILMPLLNDPDGSIRTETAKALQSIDPEAAAKAMIKEEAK